MKDEQPLDYYDEFSTDDLERDFFALAVLAFVAIVVVSITALWWFA